MTSQLSHSRAFTLIELLTVIAVIGILAAIIIPTVGVVTKSSKKAQVRAMFGNWRQGFELFKQEYGYYPVVTGADTRLDNNANETSIFVRTFTGKEVDGTAVTPANNLNGNKRAQKFLSFSDRELDLTLPAADRIITDAFSNQQFGILVDRNGDGRIKVGAADDGTLQAVTPASGGPNFTPTTNGATPDIPDDGVLATVIIYSAGQDGETKSAVMSWK
jgi:prepilin-type N-terminal cleavage/methylation domain-containing protein